MLGLLSSASEGECAPFMYWRASGEQCAGEDEMKMTKMLTVALLMLCAMSVQSRESITIGDYEYTYSPAESNAWARNYRGSESRAVVPSSISFTTEVRDSNGCVIYDDDGKPKRIFHHYDVTEAYYTFIRKKVTEVILPSTIKRTRSAFEECSSLTSVDLNSVEIIDDYTFWGCTSLSSIEIPSTVTTIGRDAFKKCSSLSSIAIPSSVTNIGQDAFIDCDALTSIETPSSLRCLGSGSFRYCASLKSAEINGANLAVEGGTFQECPNLETATLGPGIISIADGSTTSGYEWGMFAYCTSLKSVTINTTSVVKLPIAMFYRSSVQTVSVAGGFAEIGRGAFYRCTSLEEIEGCLAPITIGDSAFYKCSKFKSGVDFSRCETISGYAFYECSSLTSVRFGPNLSSIGSNAFYGCYNLELVAFDGAPPSVGSGVFSRVKNGAVGTYTAAHAAEWEAVIDADGKWNGLIMKQQEPPPPPTLSAESADWSMGSITLSATGFIGNSLEDISISYCNANTGGMVWLTPEGSEITKAWSADGKTLLVTDSKFSRRLDGVCPIKYRIVDKFGNAVDSPSMRNRHGLAVGVSKYDKVKYGLNAPEESESFRNDAELFIEIMERSGGGILHENMISLMDNGATTNAISAAWENLAKTATIPGDLIFFYIATHGGNRKEMSGRGVVTAYDGPYTAQRFQSDLAPFKRGGAQEGVKVVAIMANCHSESMAMPYGADDEGNLFSDSANILYVASASAEESSIHWGVHSQFALYFLKNGLELGQADAQRMMHGQSAVGEIGNRDGEVNLLECARYAQELSTGWSSIFPAHVTYDFGKVSVMADTILVAGSSHAAESAPGAPGNVEVRNWQERGVSVCFGKPSNADFFKVYYQKVDDIGAPKWITSINNQCDIYTLDVANESYREREAQLMNGAAYRFWVVACGPGGMSDPSKYVEFTTPIENSRTYTVGFDANGARDAYGNPISLGAIVVPAWKEVGSLPELDWVGHTFVGWYFNKDGRGERVMPTTIIVRDSTCYAVWTAMTMEYLNGYPFLATASSGDIATAAAMTAANGCRTVGECYALGIDPEDPDDDFKVTHFEMKDGKPVITLNHTEDGSGNSFLPRVKTLGKADLSDAEWREVPEDGDDTMRFFKVEVEMP